MRIWKFIEPFIFIAAVIFVFVFRPDLISSRSVIIWVIAGVVVGVWVYVRNRRKDRK